MELTWNAAFKIAWAIAIVNVLLGIAGFAVRVVVLGVMMLTVG